MIYVVATLDIRPDMRDDFLTAARFCATETRNEKGCGAYDVHESITHPNRFTFVERWESRDHLNAHFRQPHVRAFGKATKEAITETRMEIINVESVEPLG